MTPQTINAVKLHTSQAFIEGKRTPITVFKLPTDFSFEKEPQPGDKVKLTAKSKGKGFSGVIKRFGFSCQPRSHGVKHTRRATGSIGRGTTPGRVLPGKKMPGHHGQQSAFIKNLKVVAYNEPEKTLTLSGVTPGSRNTKTKISLI